MKITLAVWGASLAGTAAFLRVTPHISRAEADENVALVRRYDSTAADDDLWEKFVCKGDQFIQAMRGTDLQASFVFKYPSGTMRSQWQGSLKDELKEWGWNDQGSARVHNNCDFPTRWGASDSLDALGLSKYPKEEGGDNECFLIEHGDRSLYDNHNLIPVSRQLYNVDGKSYKKTGASFSAAVNQVGGVIFASELWGAASSAQVYWEGNQVSKDELPSLRFAADILYGKWFEGNPDIRNLKYYWVQGVINKETVRIFSRIVQRSGKQLAKWPGTTFSVTSDEGKAFLASPIGTTIGYMLLAHKAELGNKWVSKIQVFVADDNWPASMTWATDPDLLFHVEEAPLLENPDRN